MTTHIRTMRAAKLGARQHMSSFANEHCKPQKLTRVELRVMQPRQTAREHRADGNALAWQAPRRPRAGCSKSTRWEWHKLRPAECRRQQVFRRIGAQPVRPNHRRTAVFAYGEKIQLPESLWSKM